MLQRYIADTAAVWNRSGENPGWVDTTRLYSGEIIAIVETVLGYIRRKGLVGRGTVNAERLNRLTKIQILKMAEELESFTLPEEQDTSGTICTHCASISLGGGRDDCIYVGCRKERLDSLARFAAFYSDRVFMRNFFCDYKHREKRSVEDLRSTLADDLTLILHISPLLEEGLLVLVSEPLLCMGCLGEALGFGTKGGRELKGAWKSLANEFLSKLSVTAVLRQRGLLVKLSCPYPYSECGRVQALHEVPLALRDKSRIMSQLSKGTSVELSKTMIKALGFHHDFAGDVVHSVAYHAITNRYLSASFLTNKELELTFLNRASGDTTLERRNAIAMKYLTAVVPFTTDVPVNKLSTLRSREAESFLRFRSAFNKAIAEFGNRDAVFSAKVAQQLYGDVLAPELARLDNKVKRAKRDLVSSTMRPLVGVVGAISFGLLSGLVTAEVAHVAQAVGITSFGAAFLEKLMALGDAERAIQQDDFYFLWRAKRLSKAKRF